MNYEPKSGIIWSDERKVISGNFKLTIGDNANNETIIEKQY
jgi:hypothetical protein